MTNLQLGVEGIAYFFELMHENNDISTFRCRGYFDTGFLSLLCKMICIHAHTSLSLSHSLSFSPLSSLSPVQALFLVVKSHVSTAVR